MIINKNIDIVLHPSDALCHCANCYTTMSSGVARRLRTVYPEIYEADCLTKRGDYNKLGKISVANFKDGKVGFNIYAQYTYGTEKRQLNYEAMYTGLEAVKEYMVEHKLKTLSIPRNMGCRLAGGNWSVVEKMIEVIFEDGLVDVTICNYDPSSTPPPKVNKTMMNDFFGEI